MRRSAWRGYLCWLLCCDAIDTLSRAYNIPRRHAQAFTMLPGVLARMNRNVSTPLTAYQEKSATLPAVLPAHSAAARPRPCLSEAEAQTGPGPKQPKEPQRTLWAYLSRLGYSPAGPIQSSTASQDSRMNEWMHPGRICVPLVLVHRVIDTELSSVIPVNTPAVSIAKPIKAFFTQLQKQVQSSPPRIHPPRRRHHVRHERHRRR